MEWVGWRVGGCAGEDRWVVMGRLSPRGGFTCVVLFGPKVKLAEVRAVAASSMHLGFTGWPIVAPGGPIWCRLRNWLGQLTAFALAC